MAHKDFLHKLLSGEHFTQEEMTQCMNAIMNGIFPDTVVAALLALLQRKGITSSELTGAYYSLIAKANTIELPTDAVDTCGTGGDHGGTFNISTVGSIIANSVGVPVAKHGNRSITSSCGSADVLEELGFAVDLPAEATEELFLHTGFAFLFAPLYHPAMKRVASVRKELGIRTIFNMLGPLINPARSKRQLVGVFSSELLELYTEVLLQTGTQHAMVVHSKTEEGNALDEPSLNGPTYIIEIQNGYVCRHTVYPEDFGLDRHPLSAIKGGDRKENATIVRAILDGSGTQAQMDAALFTSAMACYVSGIANCIDDGMNMSREVLESGETEKKFKQIIDLNAELSARSRAAIN
ncbi:MAG: anthranilate phosphoribosyltransferase [Chlorobium sp.]|uniref:anthranilate phosphoribosyltransferase n=1 Tax=Chlorobium sp. TaxID=1095 RepID=UPI0025C5392B|nr:anthranilate phosphoribosyltransferase [Chlorobium sp.]MCF8215912.1 anthranilate phosphoribosyltransferase [Chlorobium sp.]MCF8270810.1 anthranilate phosphoribosyltransferase [Chlorobium sp.]MCF8287122.1 anthranilate phosphoribosyltransferase [Chlorobium sp.]MCF8290779.1 anthranilate phosphoribosyltransferase [Chlorobium sp.]MCF8384883.1 anthranilate phosphoribosyltransferase [Chlorobium sp.]